MDHETRKAITTQDYRDAPSGVGPLAAEWADKPHRLVYALCAELDARETEHTTPVTPEWMDGPEAKRLGFERLLTAGEWRLRFDAWHVDVACGPEGYIEVFDLGGSDAMPVKASPTVAQVRAAVFLATGRR